MGARTSPSSPFAKTSEEIQQEMERREKMQRPVPLVKGTYAGFASNQDQQEGF